MAVVQVVDLGCHGHVCVGISRSCRSHPSNNTRSTRVMAAGRVMAAMMRPRRDDWSIRGLCGAPLVPVMETADLGDGHNPSDRWRSGSGEAHLGTPILSGLHHEYRLAREAA